MITHLSRFDLSSYRPIINLRVYPYLPVPVLLYPYPTRTRKIATRTRTRGYTGTGNPRVRVYPHSPNSDQIRSLQEFPNSLFVLDRKSDRETEEITYQ